MVSVRKKGVSMNLPQIIEHLERGNHGPRGVFDEQAKMPELFAGI